jgi:DNA-directed RNA polymerase specialized sigma24 family protein
MIAECHAADPGLLALDAAWRTCEVRVGRFLAQLVEGRSDAEDLLQETRAAAFPDRRRVVGRPGPGALPYATLRRPLAPPKRGFFRPLA